MPLDPDVKAFLDTLVGQPPVEELAVPQFRAAIEAFTAYCAPAPSVALVRDLILSTPAGPLAARLYHPEPGRVLPVVVYFHGGGWMSGSIDYADPVCRAMAVQAKAAVLNVGYRLAPEHPYPAAVEDALAAVRWTAANGAAIGADPARLAVAGESAGANLATVTALLAREAGPRIAHQLLVCPALDTGLDTGSYRRLATGYGNTRAVMTRCWQTYLGLPAGSFHRAPWQAAPLRAPDLAGLPPATVITMEYDPLRDEGEMYAARLAAAGVPTTVARRRGMIHSALYLDGVAPRAARTRAAAATALRRAWQPA
ncbi:alpha/beta hydrolase [Peterkaempfera griseoplana]|uniref:alpha/beta hydrolase n=1 Tax=Peterkaempfera griseoplana TaxID=66896 RepID=UPI0006E1390C|nr:alpha/beta hydrolase [Peterkaempfera griseoplana]